MFRYTLILVIIVGLLNHDFAAARNFDMPSYRIKNNLRESEAMDTMEFNDEDFDESLLFDPYTQTKPLENVELDDEEDYKEQQPFESYSQSKPLENVELDDEEDYRELQPLETYSQSKRGYGAGIRTGIAIIAGVSFAGSIGLTIYQAIRKCNDFRPNKCGEKPNCSMLASCPSICKGPDVNFEFIKTEKELLKKELTILDKKQLDAFNLATDAISANLANKQILIEIDRINDAVNKMLFNMIEFDLNAAGRLRNQTVAIKAMLRNARLSIDDVIASPQVAGIFDKWTWEGTGMFVLMLALPVAGLFFQKMRERWAINQIAKGMEADFKAKFQNQKSKFSHQSMRNAFAKVQGYDTKAFKTQLKKTATSVYHAEKASKKMTKTEKFTQNVVGPLVNLVVIALSAWQGYQFYDQCQKFTNKMYDDAKTMVEKENEVKGLEINYVDPVAAQVVNEGWKPVKNLLTREDILAWLEGIKNLTLGAQHVNQTTVNTIDIFVRDIKGANVANTKRLQRELIEALGSVKYDIQCLEKKQHALATVLRKCRSGAESLKALYDDASQTYNLNQQSCIQSNKVTYTSLKEFTEIIGNFSKHQGWYSNCLLNNRDLLIRVCDQKLKGYTTIAEIVKYANRTGLTNAMAENFLTRCPPPQITPKRVQDTCKYYCLYLNATEISKSVLLTVNQVKGIMANNCSVCSYRSDQKIKICKEHFCNGVDASTLEPQVRLPLKTVQHIISNVCVQSCELTDAEKLLVCQYSLCKERTPKTISTRLGFPLASVNAVIPNCAPIPVDKCPVPMSDLLFLRYFKCTADPKRSPMQVYIFGVVEMTLALITHVMNTMITC